MTPGSARTRGHEEKAQLARAGDRGASMSLKKQLRRKHGATRHDTEAATWHVGEGVQIVIDLSGGRRPLPDDDCPICRALREAGEEVVTVSANLFES
jgi:hypothetical protein